MSTRSRAVSALGAMATRAGDAIASVLSPPRCAACDLRLGAASVFCAACARTIVAADEGRDAREGYAALAYGGAIASAITTFKYAGRPDLARPLGHVLLRAVARVASDPPTVVVPVPLHRARLVARGFNQAALLAAHAAGALRVPMIARALERTRDTVAQASLDREARRANVAGAFVARAPARVAGADVLVVDDVRTTGATLDACAAALIAAGARRVRAVVVARVE